MDKEINNTSPIKVKFISSYLWSFGYREAFENFMEWFKCFGIPVISNRISRVDICVDTDEVQFVQSDIKGVVTKARLKTKHFVSDEYFDGRKFSGFTVGRGNPSLVRVYNKTLEIIKSGKTWFYQVWIENGWNGTGDIWRVEAQIRRQILKEFCINKVENLWDLEPGLWAYFTQKWMSIKQPSGENVSRWRTKKKWVLIQTAGLSQKASPLVRESVITGNIERLLNLGSGVMISIATMTGNDNLNDTARILANWSEISLEKKSTTLEAEKNRRKKKFIQNSMTRKIYLERL
jgi:hypothetical protein